ncbi:hypothetical protein YPPY52_5019, partial [Yersinia pestis PY-52]
MRMKKPADWRG